MKENQEKKGKTISSFDKSLKEIHDINERQELLFKTESLLPQKNDDREFEKFMLRNGTSTSIKEVKDVINELAREYQPMFPNKKPFFTLMYKLNGWTDLNPHSFIKPPVCALWIKQFIYGRFDREVLPTLLAKENPLITGYIKKYKLFQFLNDKGLIYLEQYINEMIAVMKISRDWEDFENKYTKLYSISIQLKLNFNKKR
ncbi:P63C domain-containing protein [Flagellimonas oceanensis]|uniref:P63C domain-containing protein n=1 Tax=Flagellimonas oceanensis TaxID=2499163 RepID=UPI003BAD0B9D